MRGCWKRCCWNIWVRAALFINYVHAPLIDYIANENISFSTSPVQIYKYKTNVRGVSCLLVHMWVFLSERAHNGLQLRECRACIAQHPPTQQQHLFHTLGPLSLLRLHMHEILICFILLLPMRPLGSACILYTAAQFTKCAAFRRSQVQKGDESPSLCNWHPTKIKRYTPAEYKIESDSALQN